MKKPLLILITTLILTTPLSWGNVFLGYGADVNLRSKDGLTAWDYIQENESLSGIGRNVCLKSPNRGTTPKKGIKS